MKLSFQRFGLHKLSTERTTKRLASKQQRARERRKVTAMSSENITVAAQGAGLRALGLRV